MVYTDPTANPDPELLLQQGIRAARDGQSAEARRLFRSLITAHPQFVRGWLALAGVAADRAERREALEQALTLDPDNALARRGLAAIAPELDLPPKPPPPPPDPPYLPTIETPLAGAITRVLPVAHEDDLDLAAPVSVISPPAPAPTQHRRFWVIAVITALGLGILAGFWWWPEAPNAATPPEETQAPNDPVGAPTNGAAATTATPPPPRPTRQLGQAAPTPTLALPATPLGLGRIAEAEGWSATLLRPEYVLSIEGAIGELQPRGRFVLALISVANTTGTSRPIPNDLFIVIDHRGRQYRPVTGASLAYLNLFGRGQRGDAALEEAIDANRGMVSVPVIFDVAPEANNLILTLQGDREKGWMLFAP